MNLSLKVALIIFSSILILVTTKILKKGRIPIKYSLLWYFCSLIILLVAVFPFIIEYVSQIFGFKTLSNLIIAIILSLLLFLSMALTIITSGQKKKITLLIQEISMLKSKDGK